MNWIKTIFKRIMCDIRQTHQWCIDDIRISWEDVPALQIQYGDTLLIRHCDKCGMVENKLMRLKKK